MTSDWRSTEGQRSRKRANKNFKISFKSGLEWFPFSHFFRVFSKIVGEVIFWWVHTYTFWEVKNFGKWGIPLPIHTSSFATFRIRSCSSWGVGMWSQHPSAGIPILDYVIAETHFLLTFFHLTDPRIFRSACTTTLHCKILRFEIRKSSGSV